MINAVKIREDLQKKHKDFKDRFASASSKVVADRNFYVQAAMAKISLITQILVEIGAIDEMRNKKTHSESYQHVELLKNGYIDTIYLMTDGYHIVVENSNFMTYTDMIDPDRTKWFLQDGVENFDWEKFSEELLDFVHRVIYHRKESSMFQMQQALENQ